jgi:uncharacterized membrane protein
MCKISALYLNCFIFMHAVFLFIRVCSSYGLLEGSLFYFFSSAVFAIDFNVLLYMSHTSVKMHICQV